MHGFDSNQQYRDYQRCLSRVRIGHKVSFHETKWPRASSSAFYPVIGWYLKSDEKTLSHLLVGSMLQTMVPYFKTRAPRCYGNRYSYSPEYGSYPYVKWLDLDSMRIDRIVRA